MSRSIPRCEFTNTHTHTHTHTHTQTENRLAWYTTVRWAQIALYYVWHIERMSVVYSWNSSQYWHQQSLLSYMSYIQVMYIHIMSHCFKHYNHIAGKKYSNYFIFTSLPMGSFSNKLHVITPTKRFIAFMFSLLLKSEITYFALFYFGSQITFPCYLEWLVAYLTENFTAVLDVVWKVHNQINRSFKIVSPS
jgi:hypothetical protein